MCSKVLVVGTCYKNNQLLADYLSEKIHDHQCIVYNPDEEYVPEDDIGCVILCIGSQENKYDILSHLSNIGLEDYELPTYSILLDTGDYASIPDGIVSNLLLNDIMMDLSTEKSKRVIPQWLKIWILSLFILLSLMRLFHL